ncbi:MAG TPA: zinc ribbon domain-containing protein, partial [Thermoleophilia bacterium]|nr:zinc ribbon domain-containing protein [Thermoleophilia bacterium]
MVYLVLFFLAVSLAAVGYPLLATPRRRSDLRPGEAEELAQERESALAAIRDLEFEHDVGNLSEHDFASLRDEYAERAAKVLRRVDLLSAEMAQAGPVEQQDDTAGTIESQPESEEYCGACGEPVAPEDRHCGSCGVYLVD